MFLQAAAGCHYGRIGANGFLNLDHNLVGRQEQKKLLYQHVVSAVDEGEASVAQDIEADDVQRVNGHARGILHVGCEVSFLGALAKQ